MKRTELQDKYTLTYEKVLYYEEKLRKYKMEKLPTVLEKLQKAKEQLNSEAYTKATYEKKYCEEKIRRFEHILSHIEAITDVERAIPHEVILEWKQVTHLGLWMLLRICRRQSSRN